jgi:DNA-directed RNA polymerase beta' subunit
VKSAAESGRAVHRRRSSVCDSGSRSSGRLGSNNVAIVVAIRIDAMHAAAVNARSYGAVTSHQKLFSPAIFGPQLDYVCACGRFKGRNHAGWICPDCGVLVGRAERLRKKRFGHIALSRSVEHPLLIDQQIACLPVPPIAYRQPPLGSADLNELYAQVINISANDAVSRREADATALARSVAELFCNEWCDAPVRRNGRSLTSLLWSLICDPHPSLRRQAVLQTALSISLVTGREPRNVRTRLPAPDCAPSL